MAGTCAMEVTTHSYTTAIGRQRRCVTTIVTSNFPINIGTNLIPLRQGNRIMLVYSNVTSIDTSIIIAGCSNRYTISIRRQ
jgi:hypothetical protein